jgi:hypothetical protein
MGVPNQHYQVGIVSIWIASFIECGCTTPIPNTAYVLNTGEKKVLRKLVEFSLIHLNGTMPVSNALTDSVVH